MGSEHFKDHNQAHAKCRPWREQRQSTSDSHRAHVAKPSLTSCRWQVKVGYNYDCGRVWQSVVTAWGAGFGMLLTIAAAAAAAVHVAGTAATYDFNTHLLARSPCSLALPLITRSLIFTHTRSLAQRTGSTGSLRPVRCRSSALTRRPRPAGPPSTS